MTFGSLTFCTLLFISYPAPGNFSPPRLIEGRIVGGNEVSIVRHPHQISLRRRTCTECAYLHDCGGSILNEDTILTAAHCVVNRRVSNLMVIAGTNNRAGSDGTVALVSKVVTHELYNASITDYDVALLLLTTPLKFDHLFIAPVALVAAAPTAGAKAKVTGWGTVSEGGVLASRLQVVNVFVQDQEQCIGAYGARITDAMLCAGVVEGGKDACQKDSGGPLLVEDQLAGITSWAIGCARPEYPGVYVNVSHVREWIVSNVAANSMYKLK
ncbi:PREDICTED: trypsin eta-like [Rhagoletis zephyria]|uniref:trypsin eta-like n=1 Tax=Rhagoletis zephyria TaxID=28612 RepID=UPI000811442F|nr:PREDICTED: trypsin eta-like [Rhagoletis zephyria]